MSKAKPQYQHDCNRCVFLDRYKITDKETKAYYPGNKSVDLYYCKGSGILARYGNEGSEYTSSPVGFCHESKNKAHKAAELIAKEKGLLSTEELIYLTITNRQERNRVLVLKDDIKPHQAHAFIEQLHHHMIFSCDGSNGDELFGNPYWRLACLSLEQALMNLVILQKESEKEILIKQQEQAISDQRQAISDQNYKNYDFESDIKSLQIGLDNVKCGL